MNSLTAESSLRFKIGSFLWIAIVMATLFTVYKFANFKMLFATFSYLILCTGLILRQNIRIHPRLMILGITFDLGLVIFLQFQKHAIQTAVSFTLTPIQQAHVGFSTLATLLYFPVLYFGFKRWNNPTANSNLRKRHIYFGLAAFAFRTIGFFLMFTLLSRQVNNV